MSSDQTVDRAATTRADTPRAGLRAAARLALGGQLLFIAVTQLHTGGAANDHHHIFAAYAGSGDWKGVHALQFLAVAAMVGGLVLLASALEARAARTAWAGWTASASRIGAVLAVVSLALYGVLQAVDGIGNKQVDHAWVTAPATEKSARFASAESMRWLEWGVSSYHAYAIGLALLAFAAAAARAVDVPRTVGWLLASTGIAYLAEGWVAGTQGYDAAHSALIIATWLFSLSWMTWLAARPARRA
jgi:hypothetical protein